MPRDADNNPTERILRILDDYEDLLTYVQQVQAIIIAAAPEVQLPPTPIAVHVMMENQYQRLMHGKTMHARKRMKELRDGAPRQHTFAPRQPRKQSPQQYTLSQAAKDTRTSLNQHIIDAAKAHDEAQFNKTEPLVMTADGMLAQDMQGPLFGTVTVKDAEEAKVEQDYIEDVVNSLSEKK